jgi:hypothetical protein
MHVVTKAAEVPLHAVFACKLEMQHIIDQPKPDWIIFSSLVWFSLFSHPFSHQKCDIGHVKFSVQYKLQNNL